ncbi:MAG: cytochrome c biogenesis protein ResB [Candidatus Margulisiibacteriota bacterium]
MKKLLSNIWDYLSSNTFAVILIFIIAVFSLLGTVIPQKQSGEIYVKLYGEAFTPLFYLLHLTDLFGSLLFKILMTALGMSLTACSINRLLSAFKDRFNFYSWGSFFAHLSTLVIFAGAIHGGINGFSSDISIEKGHSYFEQKENFHVKLNDFNAKFDANGRALDFSSDLTVVDSGKEVLRKTIYVNKPLEYKGIKFYQSSYGLNGVLSIKGPDGRTEDIPIYKGGCATYSRTGLMLCVQEFFSDMKVLHGRPQEVFEPTAPVIFLTTHGNDGGKEEIGWLILGKQLDWNGYSLKLVSVKEYTGLQVKKDPGVPFVYLGFFLLSVGVCIMMYARHGV